jgi:hypothetical protein
MLGLCFIVDFLKTSRGSVTGQIVSFVDLLIGDVIRLHQHCQQFFSIQPSHPAQGYPLRSSSLFQLSPLNTLIVLPFLPLWLCFRHSRSSNSVRHGDRFSGRSGVKFGL